MPTVQFTRKFSAAHRIVGGGICERIHGHNYEAEIIVETNVLGDENFIVPADLVKVLVDGRYDHRLILVQDDPLLLKLNTFFGEVAVNQGSAVWIVSTSGTPSTEFLAQQIAEDVAQVAWDYLGGNTNMQLDYVEVTCLLRETPTISAIGYSDIRNHP